MKKQTKKEIGTRELQNNIEMVLKGHDHNVKELWVTAKYNDKPKMDERKKDKQATAFRIEGQVLEDMKAIALENERSLNWMVVNTLKNFIEGEKKKKKKNGI